MAVVGTHITIGKPITLGAADEFTPVAEVAGGPGLVDVCIQFDGSWSGTLRFDRAFKVDGTWVYDPILATNLISAATATSTTGGASATETWRVDASGGGIRVYASVYAAGEADVTFAVSEG